MGVIESIVIDLQSELFFLKSEIDRLNNVLDYKISLLMAVNKSLSDENAKLKEKLGLTSSNASISTSKELYKKKPKISALGKIVRNYTLSD